MNNKNDENHKDYENNRIVLEKTETYKKINKNLTVKEIVINYLKKNNFDGLHYDSECSCKIDDLLNCGNECTECKPGNFINCNECCFRKQLSTSLFECEMGYDYCIGDK